MQRIWGTLLTLLPGLLAAQQSAGTELWRLAATTLPIPPALATGGAAAFWNPAQPTGPERGSVAFEAIETSPEVGAQGVLLTARARVTRADRWTLDVGASRAISDWARVAAATHFFSRFAANDPAQDLYAGAELRVWHGPLWEGGTTGAIRARYGMAFAHGFTADHQFGAAFEVGNVFAADFVVVREGSYGDAGWRPVAGMRVTVGRYRLSFARDAALNDVGAAYRVGLEARLR